MGGCDDKMNKKYRLLFFLSGILQSLAVTALAGIVGAFFILFAFLGKIALFKWVGFFALLFYIVAGVRNGLKACREIIDEYGENVFETAAEDEITRSRNIFTFFGRVCERAERGDSADCFAEKSSAAAEDEAEKEPLEKPKLNKSPAAVVIRLFGALFILFGIYTAAVGIGDYAEQVKTKDWLPAEATVTRVTPRKQDRGFKMDDITVYDIEYIFSLDGCDYAGEITGTPYGKTEGEVFTIRYNPLRPESSTDITAPQADVLTVNLVAAVLYIAMGLFVTGLFPFIIYFIKKKKRDRGG